MLFPSTQKSHTGEEPCSSTSGPSCREYTPFPIPTPYGGRICFPFLETGYHYAAVTGLELGKWTRLTLNSQSYTDAPDKMPGRWGKAQEIFISKILKLDISTWKTVWRMKDTHEHQICLLVYDRATQGISGATVPKPPRRPTVWARF